jgi:hypothetical protein
VPSGMDGLGSLGVGVVLWRLTPVEHPVVAHDPDAAQSCSVRNGESALELFGRLRQDTIKIRSPGVETASNTLLASSPPAR